MVKAVITGTGSYLPSKIISNDELTKTIATTDEWIVSRTGIKQRHIADDNITTASMAAKAGQAAIAKAGLDTTDIDLIILATTTPDKTFPASAVLTQSILGAKNAAAFDVQAVCAGFIFALSVAEGMIMSGRHKNILVIGADKMSSIVNWEDRGTCILFGDGAGAVVLNARNSTDRGMIGFDIKSDGNYSNILYANHNPEKLAMMGKEVFKHAIEKMASSLEAVLSRNNIMKDHVDWLVPHQANERIIDTLAGKLNFQQEKIVKTVSMHANTSAASIPLALDEAVRSDLIKEGQLVAVTAIGGGLSWGAGIFRL